MNKYDEIKKEIEELYLEGKKLFSALYNENSNSPSDYGYFVCNYEAWYSKAQSIVKTLFPDRYNDFILLYRNDKRKNLELNTYTISDAMRGVRISAGKYGAEIASSLILSQCEILKSCKDKFDYKVCNIKAILQADVFDSEIESAQHLLKKGFLRASGAICGVVLEKHFSEICKNRNIQTKKKSPTISDFNDELKDVVYDTIEWRKIQHLGDIRNLCDHNKDREPTKEEVEDLITGTERVIKTIF